MLGKGGKSLRRGLSAPMCPLRTRSYHTVRKIRARTSDMLKYYELVLSMMDQNLRIQNGTARKSFRTTTARFEEKLLGLGVYNVSLR